MHEMALTESVIGIVEDEARRQNFARVRAIVLEIGALACAEPDAMRFCFDVVSRGTPAEGARLDIVRVPGAGWCFDCERDVALAERFGPCGHCGGHRVQMTGGDELRVREMEVE
jgi:hydrogenase nickel incorporation protein HypA/HybF